MRLSLLFKFLLKLILQLHKKYCMKYVQPTIGHHIISLKNPELTRFFYTEAEIMYKTQKINKRIQ